MGELPYFLSSLPLSYSYLILPVSPLPDEASSLMVPTEQ
jgi:hypothetical protein